MLYQFQLAYSLQVDAVLWMVTVKHAHVVACYIVEVVRQQGRDGGFPDASLLG